MRNEQKKSKSKKNSSKKVKGFSIIELSEAEINSKSNEVSTFIFKYIAVEYTCKQIIEKIKETSSDQIKMHLTTIKSCFKKYGVVISDDDLDLLFSSKKKDNLRSCKSIRNAIVHTLNKGAIKDLKANYEKYNKIIERYFKAINATL